MLKCDQSSVGIVNVCVNMGARKFYRKMTFALNLDESRTVVVTIERGYI